MRKPAKFKNEAAKTAVVTALLSERYQQGEGYLRNDVDEFCCLGVACAEAVDAGVEMAVGAGGDDKIPAYFYDGASQYLPRKAIEWLGVEVDGRTYTGDDFESITDFDNPAVTLDEEFIHSHTEHLNEPTYRKAGEVMELSGLNDNHVPFALIAGLIERQM